MDVAIIGISIKCSDIETIKEFQEILKNEKNCITQPKEERLINSRIEKKEAFHPYGYLDRVDLFDHDFFNISKAEANSIDPGHRMILQEVCTAIENSGYNLDYISSQRTGLFTTTQTGLYNLLYQSQSKSLDFIGGLPSIGGGRIANILNIRGPVMNIDTACSSSLVALHEGVQNIKNNEIDVALIAGSRLLYVFNEANSFDGDAIMSADGLCKAFDNDASGTSGGEGVAVIVLKRLDYAIRDNDNILSIIKGSAINNDGGSSNSITAPSPSAQKNVILNACKNAGVPISSIGYIETHGTGTKLGDPIEYKGIKDAFTEENEDFKVRLGTLKPNIGHLDNMSGLFGLIKASIVLKENQFFPLVNFSNTNHFIEEHPSIVLQKEGEKWLSERPRRAGVSSFGLSGTNVHVILEEYNAERKVNVNSEKDIWFKIAAKNKESLKEYLHNIHEFISSEDDIENIAYTLNTGRNDYKYRVSVSGNQIHEIKNSLLNHKENWTAIQEVKKYNKVALLYLSDDVQEIDGFLKTEDFNNFFSEEIKKIKEANLEASVSQTLAFQVSLFKNLSQKGFNINQIVCNGSVSKTAKELIEGKYTITESLSFDKEFSLDFDKLKQFSKGMSQEGTIFLVVGRNNDAIDKIIEIFNSENIPGFDLLKMVSQNSWSTLWSTLYNAGLQFDWEKFYSEKAFRKATVPTYPFQKIACWNEINNPLFFNKTTNYQKEITVNSIDTNLSTEETVMSVLQEVLQNKNFQLTDDFFELGGNSIVGIQFINRINELFNIKIVFDDLLNCYEINEIVSLVVTEKNKIEETVISSDIKNEPVILNSFEASNSQQRMWIESQIDKSAMSHYNINLSYNVKGEINISVFQQTLQKLIKKHSSLRAYFPIDDNGIVIQKVQDSNNLVIENYFEYVSENDNVEIEIKEIAFQNTSFDLEKGPLFKALIIKSDDNNYRLAFIFHHIIFDGWSTGVFIKDFATTYQQILNNTYSSNFEDYDYLNYLAWLKVTSKSEDYEIYRTYWQNKLKNINSNLQLGNSNVKTFNGNKVSFSIDANLRKKLIDFATKNRVTLYSVLVTSIRTFLYRVTNENFVIGTAVSGRVKKDFESVIGLFINTLPLYTEIDNDKKFSDCLANETLTITEALESQVYPYDLILNDLKILEKQSFFDVMVVLQNQNNRSGLLDKNDLPFEIEQNLTQVSEFSRFNLSFTFIEVLDAIELDLEYKSDVFTPEFISALMDSFFYAMEEFVSESDREISRYSIINDEQFNKVVYEFNETEVDYPEDKTIIDLFEEQVAKTPNNIAVVFDNKELTYKELNAQANQLAQFLRNEYKIEPDDLIGIKLDRSDKMIVVILGILKSGAAYVPIDPTYPIERIEYIENDSNSKVIIDESVLALFYENQQDYSEFNIPSINTPKDLAYIIYTSGTTGNPKGVMVEHQNLVSRITYYLLSYNFSEEDCSLFYRSYCFDGSIEEYFIPLFAGGKIAIVNKEFYDDLYENLIKYIERYSVTKVNMPPTVLNGILSHSRYNELLCNLKSLKHIVSGGDVLNIHHIKNTNTKANFYNTYGPTENTIDSTSWKIDVDSKTKESIIGSPVINSQVYILDANLQAVGIGITGTIYVSGTGVSRGYLNRPELTEEKFVSNPFIPGTKMYDTGDLGRWLADGNIEFLGRNDHQVKIRGFRIELGEIENSLLQYTNDLKQVVVQDKEVNGEKVLVAYYVTEKEIDKAEMRSFLQSKLPEFMIPSFFVALESLPLTSNGKVDRKALPSVSGHDIIRKEYIAPKNEDQEKMAAIWQEVLGVTQVGITDNFFELGGHSLIVAQVINRFNKQLGKTISYKDFFSNPTIKDLSEGLTEKEYQAIPQAAIMESYPLTASQYRLWILSQMEEGSLAYNIPSAIKLTGEIEINQFKETFKLLIGRHEILRTSFRNNEEGELRQYIIPESQISFEIDEKDFSNEVNQANAVSQYIETQNAIVFNLENAPLLRAGLIKLDEKQYVFYICMHHIISDGWSLQLIVSEVVKIYNSLTQGEIINLPTLNLHYKDYAVWLNEEKTKEKYQKSEAFWLDQFSGEIPVLEIPSSHKRPLIQTFNGNSKTFSFSSEFLKQLEVFSAENEATLFMTLMSGIKTLLYRYTNQNDITVGTPIAGREHPDLENQIGLYLNTLAIRSKFDENSSFTAILNQEKETLLAAYEHQDYSFDDLIGNLNLKRDMSRSPLFDVVVVLQNQAQVKIIANNNELNRLQVEGFEFENTISKFDLLFTFNQTDQLSLTIEYNTDIYDALFADNIFRHLQNLYSAVIENPSQSVDKVDYLTSSEKTKLLLDFNNIEVGFPEDKTIIDLFEEQVSNTPGHIAVVFEEAKLTYTELNEQANQLGRFLRNNYKIEPDDLIGIKLDRSEKMIVVILGILKAGAAYVPIDPSYPQERIDYIEKDSNCKIIVDENVLELFYNNPQQYSGFNIDKINKPKDLAYVIYTSGTTGNPKGVLIEHKNVVRLLKTDGDLFDFNSNDVWTMFHSYCFDFSVWEMYGALLNGGKLIIISLNIARDPSAFLEVVNKERVTVLNQTPSVFYNVSGEDLKLSTTDLCLRYVIFGGEALSPRKLKDWYKKYPDTKLVNMYGITETTVHVTYKEITEVEIESNVSNIGKPIPTLSCYVLDQNQNLLPIGIPGELYVGGEGVARGYLNKETLTNERFIQSPFHETERLYRSGDEVKILENGELEYLGRKDHQVKIRGFRIELGEIENTILKYSEDLEQVIVEVKEINQEKVLVAYILISKELDKSDLRNYLKSKLPEYMIPGFFVELKELLLTSNGKIDRKSLPAISGEDRIKKEYVAPKNKTEESLITIWQEVLGMDKIGVTDDFFELGGDSIRSIRLLSKINNELGLNYKISDIYKLPSIEQLLSIKFERVENDITPSITQKIEESFENLAKELVSDENIVAIFPMSDIELGMIYASFLHKSLGAYHDQFLFPVPTSDFDESKFSAVVQLLVEKHEILRTAYNIDDYSKPVHLVYKNAEITIDFEDISDKNEQDQQAHIKDFMLLERTQNPFDIAKPGLWRMKIYTLGENQRHMLFQCHHAVLDGWSLASLITELNNTYVSVLKEEIESLEKLSLTYKDYVFNQNCIKEIESQNNYWEEQLTDYKRLDIFTEEAVQKGYNYTVEGELYDALQQYSLQHGISIKTLTFCAYLHTLQMLTYDNDVTVGLVTNGRPISEDGDKILGCFLNTIPVRFKESKSTLSDFVRQINNVLNIQKQYEGISLFELHSRFSTNNLKENPFFDTLFNYIDFHIFNELDLEEGAASTESPLVSLDHAVTNTFLDLTIRPVPNGINITWFQQRIFKGGITVDQLQSYYYNFLESLVKQSDSVFNKSMILSTSENTKLILDFNNTKAIYPENKTIIDLFEDQVIETPDNIAVVFENTQLTYQELNEKANQLGQFLRSTYNIEADDLIGIKLNRNENIIIAILGILKSGAAYVPIDPSYPQDRIEYIEKDCNCKVIIDEVILDLFYGQQQDYSVQNIEKINTSEDLAYIIYTSGTTGNPKGVMVENRNVVNLIISQTNQFKIDKNEKILQLSNYTFDASVEQIFLALLNGAGLYIISKEMLIEEHSLEDFIHKNGITHCHAVPAILEKVSPDTRFNLKRVIAGGDICSEKLANSWSTVCDFYNEYGPTETTVTSIEFLYNSEETFSIGKPIANTQVYILDNNLQPVGIGVTGKIYISGAGVTRGYLNKPELTAEKFIPNPFVDGTKMYDTGDLGRWLPEGNIEFSGRNDDQVKIRGFRIELGEIESSLLQFSAHLKQVVVQAKVVNNEKVLVVYYVSETEIDKTELRSYLHTKLPEYMVPSFYIALESMPLTAIGKINRNALPDIGQNDIIRKEYIAPRNETEQKMAEIWQEILGIDNIGATDNFFELGGHSLSATKLISMIHKRFNVKLSIIDLFDNIILEELALFLENTLAYSNTDEDNDISMEESENFSL